MKRTEGTTTDVTGEQTQPLTAEWLKANTRIHGWLSFFIFVLVCSSLKNVGDFFSTYKVSDYGGSNLLGMAGISLVVELVMVAVWSIISFCRRSPSAVFWAKYYIVLVLLTNVLALWCGVENQGLETSVAIGMAMGSVFWSIIWLLYLSLSQQVQVVIPKRYRHVGIRTWLCAGLVILIPLIFGVVGMLDVAINYHGHVEISQSELASGELTDGHIVFKHLDGWTFGMEKLEGINVCSFTNSQELVLTLVSGIDSDDSKDNFVRLMSSWANAEFEKFERRIARDDVDALNGHTCYRRIVRYDRDGADPIFWHFACMFDNESGKVVIVNGYFFDIDVPDIERLLQTIRFKK